MHPALLEGALYSTEDADGTYTIIKILKVDKVGVHVRQYSNRFGQQPTSIDPSTLFMLGIHRKPEEKAGIGHMPIAWESFASWNVQLVQHGLVSEEELEGYECWKEAEGGYFQTGA